MTGPSGARPRLRLRTDGGRQPSEPEPAESRAHCGVDLRMPLDKQPWVARWRTERCEFRSYRFFVATWLQHPPSKAMILLWSQKFSTPWVALSGSVLDTWVTFHSGDIGYTLVTPDWPICSGGGVVRCRSDSTVMKLESGPGFSRRTTIASKTRVNALMVIRRIRDMRKIALDSISSARSDLPVVPMCRSPLVLIADPNHQH
jgi:hypothetical protein